MEQKINIKLNGGSNSTSNPEDKAATGVETVAALNAIKEQELQEELNREYVDKRSVTISLVHNYSNYRKVNLKTLGQRKEVIGSSIHSGRILSSNASEVNKYFPELIGLSPNHPDFTSRVKAWLSNIQFRINENNVVLNTTFIYERKKDYLFIKQQEDAINNAYDKIDRSNMEVLKEALKRKIEDLNTLESSKHQYGRPQNLEEYLMYRHCLLYKEVAKDIALINSDPSLRFYIKDELKEREQEKKLVQARKVAMTNYIETSANASKFNAVYLSIAISRNDNLHEALLKEQSVKDAIVMNFVNEHPDKFNKIVNDKHIMTKALIETLIIRGELIRSEFNQQISTADGTFVGSNMNEAVAWFDNPNNKGVRDVFENKLKLF